MEKTMLEIKEIDCKSALVKSNLPDADYVINPYSGCEMACSYCYAAFMCRFMDKPFSSWGNFIYPKINILEVLQKQLLSKKLDKTKTILLSSVTDPYTFIEKKYELTKSILEILYSSKWQGRIGILSKNPLLTRDINVFQKLQNVEVGMTITSNNNNYSRILESKAPLVKARLNALAELNANNIKTYAFIGPIIPQYMQSIEDLEFLFQELQHIGTFEVYMEFMNLGIMKNNVVSLLNKEIGINQTKNFVDSLKDKSYIAECSETIRELLKKYNIKLKLNMVMEHKKLSK